MWFFNKKYTVRDSDLMAGFIDWHSHLLPSVDDGVKQADESLGILSMMQEVGIRHVVFTPHVMEDIPNSPEELSTRFEVFQKQWTGKIELSLGSENMLDNLFSTRLIEKNLLPIHNNLLLVETSYFNPPINLDGILNTILHQGYFPVLAHPERYRYMNTSDYDRIKGYGVRFQLNVPSLTGCYGREAYEKSIDLLKKGYYDMAGLDIHRTTQFENFLKTDLPSKSMAKLKELIATSNSVSHQ